jgi:hypothetical protein
MREMNEKQIIRARFILEALGKPKDVVIKALKDLVKQIKKDGRGVEKEHYSKPKKSGDIFFSAFAEFEIICGDLEDLLGAILDYTPVTVEIIEPDRISIDISSLQEIVNDISSRFNNLDKQIKILQAANTVLQRKLQ